ncbi:MAG: Phosphoesterase RecJ domain protein [Parcubacteria group bacterium GW2011_GWC2_45_15]|nr:MAG: Phosphoesterase RecJ domain protein [Parcubacteria group bacterium GW2011_GWC2_45_15]
MIKDTATAQAILNNQHPDGDGLGALSALALFLQSQGKNYSLFCRDAISENDSFLPLLHQVTSEQKIFKQKFDPIIILDSGSLGYAGVEEPIQNMKTNYTLINIDHHSSNTNFGQLNLVQDTASSASEMISGGQTRMKFLTAMKAAPSSMAL